MKNVCGHINFVLGKLLSELVDLVYSVSMLLWSPFENRNLFSSNLVVFFFGGCWVDRIHRHRINLLAGAVDALGGVDLGNTCLLLLELELFLLLVFILFFLLLFLLF